MLDLLDLIARVDLDLAMLHLAANLDLEANLDLAANLYKDLMHKTSSSVEE